VELELLCRVTNQCNEVRVTKCEFALTNMKIIDQNCGNRTWGVNVASIKARHWARWQASYLKVFFSYSSQPSKWMFTMRFPNQISASTLCLNLAYVNVRHIVAHSISLSYQYYVTRINQEAHRYVISYTIRDENILFAKWDSQIFVGIRVSIQNKSINVCFIFKYLGTKITVFLDMTLRSLSVVW
jgi:hypothetical protein